MRAPHLLAGWRTRPPRSWALWLAVLAALTLVMLPFRDVLDIENALEYSPAGEPVEIDVRREGKWLAFSVADHGPGVALAERERIFEPFYRPLESAPDVGGAGLGLSIARAATAAQGGSLEYAPRHGGGSMFTLRLPAVDVEKIAGQ